MNKIRVAYVVGGLPFGGVERWLYDLNREFSRTGQVEGCVFNLSGTGNLQPEYLAAGIRVQSLDLGLEGLSTRALATPLRLRRALKAFQPDIIHTMHFSANYHGRLASIGLGRPVLTHIHNIKHEKKHFRKLADKALSRLTTAYIGVSRAVNEVIQSDHNRAGVPVHLLYNAIDPRIFDAYTQLPESDLGKPGTARILAVGRYVPQKNMDKLIQAVKILKDEGLDVSLLLVGEGGERPYFESLRQGLGLEDRVVLTGFRNDVASFYHAADIFAMPSAFEGFLIAQLEAMYCGLPCIISEHVPAKEIALEASLICATDAGDIAEKIRRLLDDRAVYNQLKAAALRISRQYTIDVCAQNLMEIYRLYSGAGAPPRGSAPGPRPGG